MKKQRAELVEKTYPQLSVPTQCEMLKVPRSSFAYRPVAETEEDRELMRLMDEIYKIGPCIGTQRLVKVLERDYGRKVNRKRLRRLRREMGLETIRCRPRNTSAPDKGRRKYPYLLGSLEAKRPDQSWCADITCVPMSRGNAYLRVVMDWYSRKVRGWRLSNTMEVGLCLEALAMAVQQTARLPEVFNTDQGSQFTSHECGVELTRLGIAISMDGKGRWLDNVFIERLWRRVKREDIYLREYASLPALVAGLEAWFEGYTLGDRTRRWATARPKMRTQPLKRRRRPRKRRISRHKAF